MEGEATKSEEDSPGKEPGDSDSDLSALMKRMDLLDDPDRGSRLPIVRPLTTVRGMATNFQFMTNTETPDASGVNPFEVNMCGIIARHLLTQEYAPDQILIVTTGDSQESAIKNYLESMTDPDGIKEVQVKQVTAYLDPAHKSVDIVLLSLAASYTATGPEEGERDNALENPAGNVDLSQLIYYILLCCKKQGLGLYVFGHASLINIRGWMERVCSGLMVLGALGDVITLRCTEHEIDANIHWPLEIENYSPFGGCTFLCLAGLPNCAHVCPKVCHPYDRKHQLPMHVCQSTCGQHCPIGHSCPLQCGPCGPCLSNVTKTCPDCHKGRVVQCWHRNEEIECDAVVRTRFPYCDHFVESPCWNRVEKCEEEVLAQRHGCHHLVMIKCYQQKGGILSDHDVPLCQESCGRNLGCCDGHKCKNKCSELCGPCEEKITVSHTSCDHTLEVNCATRAQYNKCEIMLETAFKVDCGHTVIAPCYQHETLTDKELTKLCDKPCEHMGACGHSCEGTCLTCEQGMFHIPCAVNVNVTQPCGHTYSGPCNEFPFVCQQPCTTLCEHRKCDQICGRPCKPCNEPCSWQCDHAECTNKCSEVCNRTICWAPCKKPLPCGEGHLCVGYCGSLCPKICRICDMDTLENCALIGNDLDEFDRFVVLENCGHVIEMETLVGLMTINASDDGDFRPKTCPFCRAVIWNCRQFNGILHDIKREMERRKLHFCGDPKSLEEIQTELYTNLSVTYRAGPGFDKLVQFKEFIIRMMCGGKDTDYAKLEKNMPMIKVRKLFELGKLCLDAEAKLCKALELRVAGNIPFRQLLGIYERLFTWIMGKPIALSSTQDSDIRAELRRAADLYSIMELMVVAEELMAMVPPWNRDRDFFKELNSAFTEAARILDINCDYNELQLAYIKIFSQIQQALRVISSGTTFEPGASIPHIVIPSRIRE